MNRKVALKVLHAKMAKDPQVVGRFRREAQASSLLRAPHTVQIYDFDQTPDGIIYLAMEMLQGRSLHAILRGRAADAAARVARILDGIADSLGEAHAAGHRAPRHQAREHLPRAAARRPRLREGARLRHRQDRVAARRSAAVGPR